MKKNVNLKKMWLVVICFTVLAFLTISIAPPISDDSTGPLPNFDTRYDNIDPGDVYIRVTDLQQQAEKRMQGQVKDLRIYWDLVTGLPKSVSAVGTYLSRGDIAKPGDIAFNYIYSNQDLFVIGDQDLMNIRTTRNYETKHNGVRHMIFQQAFNGIHVYNAELRANIGKDGQLINIGSRVIPNIKECINIASPAIQAEKAMEIAVRAIGGVLSGPLGSPIEPPAGPMLEQVFSKGKLFSMDPRCKLNYVPVTREMARLCWQIRAGLKDNTNVYHLLVDAEKGTVILRKNLTNYWPPEWDVFTSDSPSPYSPGSATPDGSQGTIISRSTVITNGDPIASPAGWIPAAGTETEGNNCYAQSPPFWSSPLDAGDDTFDFPLDLSLEPTAEGNWQSAMVNAFYWANWYHDRLYNLGFTEAAGNFQDDNFGLGGVDGDSIRIWIQMGDNNCMFISGVDGITCTWNIGLFYGPTPNRDASFDMEIGFHELTHGLSHRLVGGPSQTMSGLHSLGLGEGWSDFYALALLGEDGDDMDGVYAMGGYASYQFLLNTQPGWASSPFTYNYDDNYYYGIRRYPYTTDLTKSPLTFSDVCQADFDTSGVDMSPFWIEWDNYLVSNSEPAAATDADESHNMGEIWCLALWECYVNLVDIHGFTDGREIMLQLTTDGMALLTDNTPTFLNARDAILWADIINNGGANICALWEGFAKRGFGVDAEAPAYDTTTTVVEGFNVSPECLIPSHEPVDLLLVLDISGSMDNLTTSGMTRIEVLQNAVELFISSWQPFAVAGDNVGVVFFESDIHTYAIPMEPFIGNEDFIIDEVNDQIADGCTSLGGGIQTAYDALDAGPNAHKYIILFTDGIQNCDPKVTEEENTDGFNRLKITTQSSTCSSCTSPVVPDGDFLEDHEVEIHTIAVGQNTALWLELIERIAQETGGLHHATSAPDIDLFNFYIVDLVDALCNGSIHMVDYLNSVFTTPDKSKTHYFTLNKTIRQATFTVAWYRNNPGRVPPDFDVYLYTPGGSQVPLQNKLYSGDYYKRINIVFPLQMGSDDIMPQGNWLLRIIPVEPLSEDINYDVFVLADESELKYDLRLPGKMTVGMDIPISLELSAQNMPVTGITDATVTITYPSMGVGTFLVQNADKFTGTPLVSEKFGSRATYILNYLLKDPDLSGQLAPLTDKIQLFDDGSHGDLNANDGIYSNIFNNTNNPGNYEFNLKVNGKSEICGTFSRSLSQSLHATIKEIDLPLSDVSVTDYKEYFHVSTKPMDKYNNYLGPDYSMDILILQPGKDKGRIVPLKDNLDGSYAEDIRLTEAEQATGVTFTLMVNDNSAGIIHETNQDVPGDVNGDTNIDIVDALLTAQYYVGLNPQAFNPAVADVNCDSVIDIVDALIIAQYYVGLLDRLPC